MIAHPAIIALLLGAVLISVMLLQASLFAVRLLRHWDLASGSERQVSLERQTYLVATEMALVCVFQLLFLFLFITTVDSLCTLFPGAMCAAGTLNLNPFGYPALMLQLVVSLLAAIWLILNRADNRAVDYPLIRVKYGLLLLILPLQLAQTGTLFGFFLSLRPHVMTSCCGSLFSEKEPGMAATMAAIPVVPVLVLLAGALIVTVAAAISFARHRENGYQVAAMAAVSGVIGIIALIAAIPVYVYALPSHHCPFCLLHREYGHVGYLFYLSLFGGVAAGLGVGALEPFKEQESLHQVLPLMQRRLALGAAVLFSLFFLLAAGQIIFSELTQR